MVKRVKTVQESDLRMLGSLARNIQRVLPVTQADIDAAAALGKGWVVWKVFEVSDPLDNLRGGTQLIIRQNSIQPGQNVRRVIFVAGPGGQTVVIRGTDYIVLPDAIANSLSYVKAFGGTEQRNIPQPYTQVNYVTNTIRTAVDTGIMIDFAKNYEFEVECRAATGSWYILQSRASSSGNITGISGANSGSTITLVVGNVTVCTSAITRTVGNKLYVKATLNAGTATLYVKDETANTEDTQTGSYGTSQPNPTAAVYLLGNAGGQYVDINSDIYMARIKENGVTVMDYVPARQAATAGFYDKASGTFKTALTPANLSADGNTVPTPDAPMDIVSNNGKLVFRDTELPTAYRRILGMTMNNDCYYEITGFKMNGSDTLRFSFTRTGANACNVLGAYDGTSAQSNYSLYAGAASSANYLRYNGGTYNSYAIADKKYDVVMTPTGSDGMENDSTWTAKTFTSTTNLCIGTTSPSATSSKMVGSIHGTVIVDSRLELIPCERVSDGEIGYYDTYTETFFEPIGTTPTSLGYDYTKYDIVAAGPIETIKLLYNHWDMTKASYSAPGFNIPSASVAQDGTFSITNTSGSSAARMQLTLSASVLGLINGQKYTLKVFVLDGNAFNRSCYIYHGSSSKLYSCDGTQTTLVDSWTQSDDNDVKVGYVYFKDYDAGTIVRLRIMVVAGETEPDTYQPYIENTATAEMLLKLFNKSGATIYAQDVQNVTTGEITRNVGVKVFVGTETWTMGTNQDASNNRVFYTNIEDRKIKDINMGLLCSHFNFKGTVGYSTLTTGEFCINQSIKSVYFDGNGITTVSDWKQWLADQYAAGTPVIVVYPLETPTTESVAGQPLQVQAGDNVLEITQASLTGLELEAEYQAAVELTIQEVQDANLDNNVTVTIQ